MKEYRTIHEVSGPLMVVDHVEGVTYDELAEIQLHSGEVRRCKVLEVNGDRAVVQLFDSSAGINLRKKRHDAHVALDSLWKNGIMSRKEAYRLLQLSMGLPAEDAHIAKFSAARCDEVIALSRRFRAAAARAA